MKHDPHVLSGVQYWAGRTTLHKRGKKGYAITPEEEFRIANRDLSIGDELQSVFGQGFWLLRAKSGFSKNEVLQIPCVPDDMPEWRMRKLLEMMIVDLLFFGFKNLQMEKSGSVKGLSSLWDRFVGVSGDSRRLVVGDLVRARFAKGGERIAWVSMVEGNKITVTPVGEKTIQSADYTRDDLELLTPKDQRLQPYKLSDGSLAVKVVESLEQRHPGYFLRMMIDLVGKTVDLARHVVANELTFKDVESLTDLKWALDNVTILDAAENGLFFSEEQSLAHFALLNSLYKDIERVADSLTEIGEALGTISTLSPGLDKAARENIRLVIPALERLNDLALQIKDLREDVSEVNQGNLLNVRPKKEDLAEQLAAKSILAKQMAIPRLSNERKIDAVEVDKRWIHPFLQVLDSKANSLNRQKDSSKWEAIIKAPPANLPENSFTWGSVVGHPALASAITKALVIRANTEARFLTSTPRADENWKNYRSFYQELVRSIESARKNGSDGQGLVDVDNRSQTVSMSKNLLKELGSQYVTLDRKVMNAREGEEKFAREIAKELIHQSNRTNEGKLTARLCAHFLEYYNTRTYRLVRNLHLYLIPFVPYWTKHLSEIFASFSDTSPRP